MSRSYAILGAVLVGIAGLVAIVGVSGGSDDAAAGDVEVSTEDSADAATTPAIVDEADADEAEVTDVIDEAGLEPVVLDTDCTLTIALELGDEHPEVACLEAQLMVAGLLGDGVPDDVFDEATDAAVRAFQTREGLVVDGMVGPQTATQIGAWAGPEVLPPDPDTCPATGRSAVVDRFNQRAWLCEAGAITDEMPITTALSQPDPGTYSVYAKDLDASSTISGGYSEMTHFVAFTYGKYQGARIAFHSVPTYSNGEYVQPLDSVGTAELHGASAGCIRVLPDDAVAIWDWLDIGDTVTVVT